jgi:hypothetical protein
MALDIVHGNPDSAATALADLKIELDQERSAQIIAQIEVDVLTRAVNDLKISTNRFTSQIPTLEDKVKHLENKVVDGLNKVRARELCLKRTTQANDDYKKQNTQLAKKLESKSLITFRTFYHSGTIFWLTPLWLVESDAELNALKVMMDNAVAFFYPGESSFGAWAP